MIFLKTDQEIKIMKEGGEILGKVAKKVASAAKAGIVLKELDTLAENLIRNAGAQPAFLGYQSPWSENSYPASICASLNEVVVHGLPTQTKLNNGDVLKIDLGVLYKNFYTDTALTVAIGEITKEARILINATKKALDLAIEQCRLGKHLGDIGFAVKKQAEKFGLKPVDGLTGHGIGKNLHEDPSVFNYGRIGEGLLLQEGLVIAIEPMLCNGKSAIRELPDGSFATKDKSLSAHFEHTIAITKNGPVILTA